MTPISRVYRSGEQTIATVRVGGSEWSFAAPLGCPPEQVLRAAKELPNLCDEEGYYIEPVPAFIKNLLTIGVTDEPSQSRSPRSDAGHGR